ncbi:unnamed protein product [Arctogadus glacialis]
MRRRSHRHEPHPQNTDLLPPGVPQRTPPLECPETEECNYICPRVTPFSVNVKPIWDQRQPTPPLQGAPRGTDRARDQDQTSEDPPGHRQSRKSSPPRGEKQLARSQRNTSAAASTTTTTTSKRCAHACVHTEQHNKARERGNSGAT